jgi:hypothetical protein
MSRSNPSTSRRRHDTPVATMTLSARTALVAVENDLARRRSMPSTLRVTRISAPSRRACWSARLASSSPETPFGKPR